MRAAAALAALLGLAALAGAAAAADTVAVRLFAVAEARSGGLVPDEPACPDALVQADKDPARDRYSLVFLPAGAGADGAGPDGVLRLSEGFVRLSEIASGTVAGGVSLYENDTGLVKAIVDMRAPPDLADRFPEAEGAVLVLAGGAAPALVPVRRAPAC